MIFKITKQSGQARYGKLVTEHGNIQTPFFMPIATKGAVRNLSPDELEALGAQIILANTYHLLLRPGPDLIRQGGGLHKFIGWPGPILTDSGGFQVFSLTQMRKIKTEGVEFQAQEDGGKPHFLTPERVLEIQNDMGVDLAMILDVCAPYPCSYKEALRAVALTTKWARRARSWLQMNPQMRKKTKVMAIVQGSIYQDLRKKNAQELVALDFDGYAIGGLAVGEPNQEMYKVLDYLALLLPPDKPRYLMGVGKPENIVQAVKQGIDMFDCVIPTREARHGRVYKFKNQKSKIKMKNQKSKFYEILKISNNRYHNDFKPIDKYCQCYTCRRFGRAYLHHLFKIQEALGQRLATIHNLSFYLKLLGNIREAIKKGLF